MKKFKKAVAAAMVAALSLGAMAGCSGGGSDESSSSDVIKLGVIAPETGNVAVYGKATINGIQLAIDEYNANGGILGKKIEAVVYDDKGDNNEAINAYKKLVTSDKVDAIIGGVISTNTLAVAPQAARDGIPMITPTGTAVDITRAGENVFRSCFTDAYQGEIIAKYSLEDLGSKKAAILYEQTDYGQGLATAFEKTFKDAGSQIVAKKAYSTGEKDFKSVLTDIKSSGADVVFLAGYYNEVALIGKQAKEVGIEATLVGGDGWDGVVEIDPASVEGGYFSNHYSLDDPSEVVQSFVNSYREKYNGEDPKSFSALGYDATKTVLEAMKIANSTDKEKVVEAMKNTNLELVSGQTKFDENRDPIKSVSIIKIEDGKYKLATKK